MDVDTVVGVVSEIVRNTFFQMFFTVGVIAMFGLAVWLAEKFFFRLVGYNFGRVACMATGFIGVPVHELGHAFFCVLFRHEIIEMRLYRPNSDDGTLGYVNHAYNGRSVYQQIGNFFIGIGPIVFGCAVLLVLMNLLVPNLYAAFRDSSNFSETGLDFFSLAGLKSIAGIMWGASLSFYSASEPGNWRWWVFMVPACSIALHMSMSMADVKGSSLGLGFIAVTLAVVNTALYFFKNEWVAELTNRCLGAGAFILNFLTISVVFALILLLFGVVVRVIRRVRGS